MYQPLQVKGASGSPTSATTLMAPKGENLRDLPQLLTPDFAQKIVNYLITSDGRLEKRGGLTELFEVAGNIPITMLEKWTDDIYMFGYGTTVAAYTKSTDTVTIIKADFTANDGFFGARYGQYFFVSNGVDKIWRIDNALAETQIAASPATATYLRVIGNRLHAAVDDSVIYSEVDDGTDPPFNTWSNGILATDGGIVSYRNGQLVRSIHPFGPDIVVFADDGKWAFRIDTIDSAGTLSKVDVTTMYRIDFGASRAAESTTEGLFYVNEAGLWQLQQIGSQDLPQSDAEQNVSILLGADFFDDIDLSSADMVYDARRRLILVTGAKNSDTNNYVIAYNVDHQSFVEFGGWTIGRFINDDGVIYGASSTKTATYECFSGYDDDGLIIGTEFRQELRLGDLFTRQFSKGCYVQGSLSPSTEISVRFDIYDRTGKPITDKLKYLWTAQRSKLGEDGWGTAAWGTSAWGGDLDYGNLVESFDGCRPFIRNFQRVILHITNGDKLPHAINWVSLEASAKVKIRRRKMVQQT